MCITSGSSPKAKTSKRSSSARRPVSASTARRSSLSPRDMATVYAVFNRLDYSLHKLPTQLVPMRVNNEYQIAANLFKTPTYQFRSLLNGTFLIGVVSIRDFPVRLISRSDKIEF